MTDWRSTRFAVVDVETTGLDPDVHEVLSIGVVDVVDGRVQVGSAWYREVRPSVAPAADTVVVHGIRPRDAAASEDPDVVGRDAVARLAGAVPVAHVARIEQGFLGAWLAPHGWDRRTRFVDTDELVRLWLRRHGGPDMREHVGLGAAASLFGLPEQRRHHALGDALTTAQLLLALASAAPGTTTEELLDPGRHPLLRRLRPTRA